MLTRSTHGEQVRTYFIELESLLVRYQAQIISGIKADIARLERNMRPLDSEDSGGYVYVIRASEAMDGIYKIGRSRDLNKRLAQYQTGRSDMCRGGLQVQDAVTGGRREVCAGLAPRP